VVLAAVVLAIGLRRIWRDGVCATSARWRCTLLATVPFVLGVGAWLTFFDVLWGSPSPAAPYGGTTGAQISLGATLRGVPGLLFDQEYGVLPYAPALGMALIGLVLLWRNGGRARTLSAELTAVFAALLFTVGAHRMWWGGTSLPGRMIVSGLLVLAPPVAWAYRDAGRRPWHRASYRLLLLAGLAVAVIVTANANLLAGRRDGVSRLLVWLSPDWHLWAFVPDFIMQPARVGLAQLGMWTGAIATGVWLFGRFHRRRDRTGVSRTERGAAFLWAYITAATTTVIATVVMSWVMGSWLKPNPTPEARSRVGLLETYSPRERPLTVRYDPLSPVDAAQLPPSFVLSATPGSRRVPQPMPVLLNARFALPAGQYVVTLAAAPGRSLNGSLSLQVGRNGGSLTDWIIATRPGESWEGAFDLPVDVNFVGFRASRSLAPEVGNLRVQPRSIVPVLDRTAVPDVLAAVAAGDLVFLLHDDHAYPERNGFWVRGGAQASLSIVARADGLARQYGLTPPSMAILISGAIFLKFLIFSKTEGINF
jgi:hypothetical protein